MEIPQRVVNRLLSNVEIDEAECWISLYSTASHGYSQIGWVEDGRRHLWLGHRVSWTAYNGPIPDGMTIDHLCRVRRCVNPDHLRLLSNIENATDNGQVRINPDVDQLCGRGHRMAISAKHGFKYCRECGNESTRRRRRARKEQSRDRRRPRVPRGRWLRGHRPVRQRHRTLAGRNTLSTSRHRSPPTRRRRRERRERSRPALGRARRHREHQRTHRRLRLLQQQRCHPASTHHRASSARAGSLRGSHGARTSPRRCCRTGTRTRGGDMSAECCGHGLRWRQGRRKRSEHRTHKPVPHHIDGDWQPCDSPPAAPADPGTAP